MCAIFTPVGKNLKKAADRAEKCVQYLLQSERSEKSSRSSCKNVCNIYSSRRSLILGKKVCNIYSSRGIASDQVDFRRVKCTPVVVIIYSSLYSYKMSALSAFPIEKWRFCGYLPQSRLFHLCNPDFFTESRCDFWCKHTNA